MKTVLAALILVGCSSPIPEQPLTDGGVADAAPQACVPQPQIAPCYEAPPLPDGGVVFGTHNQYTYSQDTPTTTTQFAIVGTATHTAFEFINLLVGWHENYDTTLQTGHYWPLDIEPVIDHVAGEYPLQAQGIHLSMKILHPIPGDSAVALDVEAGGGDIVNANRYLGYNGARIWNGLDLRGTNGAQLTGAICQATSCSDALGNVQAVASTMVIKFDLPFNSDNDAICFVVGLDGAATPAIHQTALALTVTGAIGAHYHYFCPGRYK